MDNNNIKNQLSDLSNKLINVDKNDSKLHILILDDAGGPSVNQKTVFSDFVDMEKDNVALFIITSKKGLSPQDKALCITFEMDNVIQNGLLEAIALSMHHQYRIDLIYTKQEDLILRASHLRELLGCQVGLKAKEALVFRDKELMKLAAQRHNIAVPPFARVRTPADILSFIQKHGFPIVLKPALGSSSAGIHVIYDQLALWQHLESQFFSGIDYNGGRHDHAGDILIEGFVKGPMYHVNGYARQGKIQYVWPFAYLNTNLEFTEGKAYGNIFIPKSDPRWEQLTGMAQRIIDAMPRTRDLIFHIELFLNSETNEWTLCEIAARRPGGSIALLMDLVLMRVGGEAAPAPGGGGRIVGRGGSFPELEFRCNVGLPVRHPVPKDVDVQSSNVNGIHTIINDDDDGREKKMMMMTKMSDTEAIGTSATLLPNVIYGDLMIPLKKGGRLISIPSEMPKEFTGRSMSYHPIAKVGHVYKGFDVMSMNTCARLCIQRSVDNVSKNEELLNEVLKWFEKTVLYDQVDEILKKDDFQTLKDISSSSEYEQWLKIFH